MFKDLIVTFWTEFTRCPDVSMVDFCSKLKACVCYSLTNFYFSQNDSPSKTTKRFLFHLKSSFCSRDIQIFVFLSSPLFLPVTHCFRAWSKINLQVYHVINRLNMNLKKNICLISWEWKKVSHWNFIHQ